MKFCQVVLLLTLGASADAVLKAQMLPSSTMPPADTVMVASETMPGGVEFFPSCWYPPMSHCCRDCP